MYNFIGIDPGASGGIALIRMSSGVIVDVIVKPFDKISYRMILGTLPPLKTHAVVEDVHAFSGQGVTSCFTFGEAKGFLEGMLFGFSIDYELVSPQKWKRFFNLRFPSGTDKKVVKDASISKAKELYPRVNLFASSRCRKEHDGMAEALLMAHYNMEDHQTVWYD